MDTPPAINPQPETLGAWIPPSSQVESQGPLYDALLRASRLKAGSANPLISILTGGPRA